ncbi:ATP-binding cassette sub-family G member 4-like [Belonocnema kinseyi]|uniref:ATP-binding cassette sub-family G member 4-like n=1 Tax=Belonocnema kinseyi TaxID=2817044 RepID=UPI00143DB4FD|nr:ATP-binding cassette sub-family G member 4-like [Belonocnema kinseyi]
MEMLMHEASKGPDENENSKCCRPYQDQKPNDEKVEIMTEKHHPHLTLSKKDVNMDITFENITYNVSLGFRKGTKEILHSINGRLPGKQLIAIMGPSGAGKSTLLDVLSGYRITGVEGTVYVNGRVRDLNEFRRSSAYITQDDRLQPLLTVKENMKVAADLKLGTDTPEQEKKKIIEEILTTLGLKGHLKTKAERLSGGQKKRLSIALELVNNPTVMFLDEPTTGLDSSSCTQVVNLLKLLARQGKTIVCTIHQPSASLFQIFDQVYVLSGGECLYQGAVDQLVPYLESVKLPCPMYHNPADYVIELACGEYGEDKIEPLVAGTENGRSLQWFDKSLNLLDQRALRGAYSRKEACPNGNSDVQDIKSKKESGKSLQATSQLHQLKVLLMRGFIKVKRDPTLTHLRIIVNICTGIMLGSLFIQAGNDGYRVLENYNLLFGILMHHMMTTMMLTILTFPTEMSILQKEHFNRWYSLKAFYISVTIVDIPVSVLCCTLFSFIVYFMSAQPADVTRFAMFFTISLLVSFVAQSFGLMIGAVFNVVNGTFLGPTISVPMMMFAGFGVTLRDMPAFLKWGTYVSYLRYGLEGYVNAIYGLNRKTLACKEFYCHYRKPKIFLNEIAMRDDQFWNDVIALTVILLITRVLAYILLRWKLMATR